MLIKDNEMLNIIIGDPLLNILRVNSLRLGGLQFEYKIKCYFKLKEKREIAELHEKDNLTIHYYSFFQ